MTVEIALLFGIIIVMVIVMALEKLPTDTMAVIVMVILILGGFVTPSEGIAGLSNPAVVTILSLMILTVGLETTGVITAIGKRIKKLLIGKEWKMLLFLLLIAGSCSALISTTAVVIVFMRILIKLSKSVPLSLSRFLMPLSFAGILGGSCTLLGTSTNLLVSSIALEHGLPEFSVFEFSHIGIVFFLVGLVYLLFAGRFLLPNRKREDDLTQEYAIHDYLTEIVVEEKSILVGKRIDETPFFTDEEIDLIEIKRKGSKPYFPNEIQSLQAGDILLVKSSLEKLADIRKRSDLSLHFQQSTKDEKRLNTEDMALCEVIVKPNSRLVGSLLNKITIKRDYDAIPLAVKKNRRYYSSALDDLIIESGDTLLLEIGKVNFRRFYNSPEFVVLQEHEDLATKTSKKYLAAGIMATVIVLSAFNVLPILVSTLTGCVAMFLTGCLELQKAYRRIDWNVFFLLAGVIPLGTAMNNTGASELIANSFVDWFGELSPRMMIAILYLSITLLSAVISNNATAILFAPIVISIASNLSMDPRPLLLTVMFASNMSFITPIGYQTNTLVFSAGHYRFVDFFKVGGLLCLLIWLFAIWLIPMF
mgnify:FL=1